MKHHASKLEFANLHSISASFRRVYCVDMMLSNARNVLRSFLNATWMLSRKFENSCIFELSVSYREPVHHKEIRSENRISPTTPSIDRFLLKERRKIAPDQNEFTNSELWSILWPNCAKISAPKLNQFLPVQEYYFTSRKALRVSF